MAIEKNLGANKEQLQRVAAVLGAGVVVLGLLYYLVLSPMVRERDRLLNSIDAEREALAENRSMIKQEEAVQTLFAETGRHLTEIMTTQLAPKENPVSWISSIIQDVASKHGVVVRNMSGAGTVQAARASRDAPPPIFETFQVQIELRANYHEFGRFLAELETRIPYARIDSLSLQPGADGDARQLQIAMRYGIPRFTEDGFPSARRPTPALTEPRTQMQDKGEKADE